MTTRFFVTKHLVKAKKSLLKKKS